jgi:predicted acylesterase/phospholipase RssA
MQFRSLACLFVSVVVSACSSLIGPHGGSYRNDRDPGSRLLRPAVPVPRATGEWTDDKPVFVGLAISGGGSRSAVFGTAVLEQLDRIGVLQHVDAVSAVSGGSIPAAWLAINGERPDWSDAMKFASSDFLGPLIRKLVNPINILLSTVTDRDRTDALAEVFDEKLFRGARVTFAALGPRGPRRPAVYFNATDTTGGGVRFVFDDLTFFRQIGSDLNAYPISWAMAASGAFPGIFNSLTLYRDSIDPDQRKKELEPSQRRYVHVIDGGGADNLGIETLISRAREHHVARLRAGAAPAAGGNGCMIILVDAHVPSQSVTESSQSDRRGLMSVVLDLNFLDAIDALLSANRERSLLSMGIRRSVALGTYKIDLGIQPQMIEYDVHPYARVARFPIEYFRNADGVVSSRPIYAPGDSVATPPAERPMRQTFECTAWHIPLQGVQAVVPWRGRDGRLERLSLDNPQDQAVFAFRARLERVVSQIPTSYRLKGPPRCSERVVRRSLQDAARISVRQDHDSLDAVCRWFADNGLPTTDCRIEPEPLYRDDLRLRPIAPPQSEQRLEQAINRFVQCDEPDAAPSNRSLDH